MTLNDDQELTNTKGKLRLLEESYRDTRDDAAANGAARDTSLRSLKNLINQLKEEIARYEACQPVRH